MRHSVFLGLLSNSFPLLAGDSVVPEIFGVNTVRLQKLKAKYDPNGVFNKMNPITPVP